MRAVMLVAGLILSTAGCSNSAKGPGGPMLTGKVYYQSKALTYGVLVFHAESGKAYKSVINTDGTYRTVRPPPGTYRVTVDTTVVPAGAASAGGKPVAPPKKLVLPSKLTDPSASGVTVTITDSSETLDVTLPGESGESQKSSDSKAGETSKG